MVPQQVSFVERSSLSQGVPYRRFHCNYVVLKTVLSVQYVNMYRGHKKSAAMKVESAQEHMRSERYRELQSQATQLRQQLDQVLLPPPVEKHVYSILASYR